MVNLKTAEDIFKRLQLIDDDLCNLMLSDDGTEKILSARTGVINLRSSHYKYIDICRQTLKSSQTCIAEIIKDLKELKEQK